MERRVRLENKQKIIYLPSHHNHRFSDLLKWVEYIRIVLYKDLKDQKEC